MEDFLIPSENAVATAENYRRRKTTSVLAIVFTDIADSTRLRNELGEIRYEDLREDYDNKLAEIITRDDAGAIVKGTGDGVLAVFAEPSTAVERCLEVQDKLRDHPKLKLRIGIDMGQVSVKSSFGITADVFGRHVNRAARIEALAEPGHILTSFHIYDCTLGWIKDDWFHWQYFGSVSLKGFADSISIHEVYDSRRWSPQTRNVLQGTISAAAVGAVAMGAAISSTVGVGSEIARSVSLGAIEVYAGAVRAAAVTQEKIEVIGDEAILYAKLTSSRLINLIPSASQVVVPRIDVRPSEKDVSVTQPLKMSQALWKWLAIDLRNNPIAINLSESMPSDDPFLLYGSEIAGVVSELPIETRTILWIGVDDKGREHELLRNAGCTVSLACSNDEVTASMSVRKYSLIVIDLHQIESNQHSLNIAKLLDETRSSTPMILYAPQSRMAMFEDQYVMDRFVLCTPGIVSLLGGIHQVFSELEKRIRDSAENDNSGFRGILDRFLP